MTEEQKQNVERSPTDIEAVEVPELREQEGGFQILRIGTDQELSEALQRVENALKLVERLQQFCIARTKANDWIDQQGNPYLSEAGSNRFAAPFQIYEKEITAWSVDDQGCKREISDKAMFQGNIRFFFFSGIIGSKVLGVEASFEGGSSLEDNFQSKDDLLFYFQKAKANWRGRGFRKMLGLENITWSELEGIAKIKRDQVRKVERLVTEKAGTEEAKELHNLLLEIAGGDPKMAEDYLFEITDSEKYAGKRKANQLTAKQIPWVLAKVKAEHAKRFPTKHGAKNDGPQGLEAFKKYVEELRPKLGDAIFASLLKQFEVETIESIAEERRQAFYKEMKRLVDLQTKIEKPGKSEEARQ